MKSSLALALALIISFIATGPAAAVVAPVKASVDSLNLKKAGITVGHKTLRPKLRAERSGNLLHSRFSGAGAVRTDLANGVARVITGYEFVDSPRLAYGAGIDGFTVSALAFVDKNPSLFEINSKHLQLDKSAILFNKSEQFLKFRVFRNGIWVQDASIDFRYKYGRLVQIVNQSFAEAKTDRRLVVNNLAREIKAVFPGAPITHLRQLYRVIRGNKDAYQLERVELFEVSAKQQPFLVQVSSATGKIFEVAPTRFNISGKARGHIYPRYWADNLAISNYAELSVSHGQSNSLTNGNGAFDAPQGSTPTLDGFSGSRVSVVPTTGTKPASSGALISGSWDLNFAADANSAAHEDKGVAQSNIFFHITKMVNHAQSYIDMDWFNTPLRANANLGSNCNAHWDGTTINFYSAGVSGTYNCANTGLIADVVYHEWGHGLDHNAGGIEDGAYSEGFGDICSLIFSGSNELGPGFTVDGMVVRDLEPNKVYPQDQGEVHAEGLIIAGAFYDLYKALNAKYGKDRALDKLSNFAFKSIMTSSKYTDVYDAMLVIDDDDGNLQNGTPNFCMINESFTDHGLADRASSCLLGEPRLFEINDSGGNGNGVIEPGETVKVTVSIYNNTPETLADLKAKVSIEGKAPGVSVTDSSMAWDSLAPTQVKRSSDPFALTVATDTVCGTPIPVAVALTGNNREVVERETLRVGLFEGQAETYGTTTLPAPIPDQSQVTLPIKVDTATWKNGMKVLEGQLRLDITHPYVGDLSVDLVSPAGEVRTVFEGAGSGDNVSLDIDISHLVSSLAGSGVWNLVVKDGYQQDVGTVDFFELSLTPAKFSCR